MIKNKEQVDDLCKSIQKCFMVIRQKIEKYQLVDAKKYVNEQADIMKATVVKKHIFSKEDYDRIVETFDNTIRFSGGYIMHRSLTLAFA